MMNDEPELPPLPTPSDEEGDAMELEFEESEFLDELDRLDWQSVDDQSDDGQALSSAGFGTDEDY